MSIKDDYEYLEFPKIKSKIFTVTYDLNCIGLIKKLKIKFEKFKKYIKVGILGIKIIIVKYDVKILSIIVGFLNERK